MFLHQNYTPLGPLWLAGSPISVLLSRILLLISIALCSVSVTDVWISARLNFLEDFAVR
jgi:hypothetical protein